MLVRLLFALSLFVAQVLVPPVLAQEPEVPGPELAEVIADTGSAISVEVSRQIDLVGAEVRGLAFQMGITFIVAIALALFVGIVVGSLVASLVLRRTVRRLPPYQ